MIQRVENTRIEDKENDDEDEDEIFEMDEKERKSNEDSAEEGNEASGERVNDYDPESISEKIGELRDYNDELLLPKQATSSVEGEDREGQKKVVKKSIKKKTLSQVSVRRPDEPEAKSLADLGELPRLYVSSLFNKSNNFI